MSFANLTIIQPDSPISSYALMDACEKSISFGSTMGIEATYWKRPSILYGKSYYMLTNCTYVPKSLNELMELLLDRDLPPLPRESAYPFAYFSTRYGTETKYFKYIHDRLFTYKGKKIKAYGWRFFVYFIRYLPGFRHWSKMHRIYFGKNLSIKSLLQYK